MSNTPHSYATQDDAGQSVQYLTTDQMTKFKSLAGTANLCVGLCVQTSSEAHQATYLMGNRDPLPQQ